MSSVAGVINKCVSCVAEERLRVLISQKNSFGVEEFVEEQKLKDSMQKAFTEIPQMFGSEEVLKKARSLTNNACALEAVSRLEEIYEIMKNYGYEKYISFDFGMLLNKTSVGFQ